MSQARAGSTPGPEEGSPFGWELVASRRGPSRYAAPQLRELRAHAMPDPVPTRVVRFASRFTEALPETADRVDFHAATDDAIVKEGSVEGDEGECNVMPVSLLMGIAQRARGAFYRRGARPYYQRACAARISEQFDKCVSEHTAAVDAEGTNSMLACVIRARRPTCPPHGTAHGLDREGRRARAALVEAFARRRRTRDVERVPAIPHGNSGPAAGAADQGFAAAQEPPSGARLRSLEVEGVIRARRGHAHAPNNAQSEKLHADVCPDPPPFSLLPPRRSEAEGCEIAF